MTEEKKLNYFEQLNNINVQDKIEKKNGLSYLSWAWAWQEIKKRHPSIKYEVVKNESGLPFFKSEEGYMVYTKVTIDDIIHEMWLPVMDGANKAMKSDPYTYKVQKKEWSTKYNKYIRSKDSKGNYLFEEKQVEAATMFDINTAIMRCLVKNVAMHGLGLYIYAGEDIPSAEKDDTLEEERQSLYDECKDLKKSIIGELEMAIDLANLKEIWEENAKERIALRSRMPKMHEAVEKKKEELKTKLQ
jgi:hypothetical protein